MSRITDIWIDMDNTLFDFSKGNLDRALHSMKDPSYYSTLEPFESAMDILGSMSDEYELNIVSGIPDLKMHGQYLDMSPCCYREYYQEVMRRKLELLDKYFGRGFFTTVEFTRASECKADIIKFRWYDNINKDFQHTCLIDDMDAYVRTWRKRGGHGMVCSPKNPLVLCLDRIRDEEYMS